MHRFVRYRLFDRISSYFPPRSPRAMQGLDVETQCLHAAGVSDVERFELSFVTSPSPCPLDYFSPPIATVIASELVLLPQTTLLPQITLKPAFVLLPQHTELPRRTDWPVALAPQITDEPHTTEVPQTTELPHITELPMTRYTWPVVAS